MKIKHKYIIFSLAIIFIIFMKMPNIAISGDAGGPHVLWVNLTDKVVISRFLERRIQEQTDEETINMYALFSDRPKGITDEIVRNAIIKKDKKAIMRLDKLIRRSYNGFPFYKGFDGVIVYDEENGPRFSLIERGSYTVYQEKIPARRDPKSVWETFIKVIPEVKRSNL